MTFRIANTFTDSLAKLKDEEQKAVKTTAFDLQTNPVNPGAKVYRRTRNQDKDTQAARRIGVTALRNLNLSPSRRI